VLRFFFFAEPFIGFGLLIFGGCALAFNQPSPPLRDGDKVIFSDTKTGESVTMQAFVPYEGAMPEQTGYVPVTP
jgi:hypothetical protein